jgi:phosphate-selective porin OprO/OprP
LVALLVLLCATISTAAAPGDGYEKLWSHATLYQNADNPWLQNFRLSGRAQGDTVNFDADEGDYDDTRWRRFRFGFTAGVLEQGTVRLEGDFDFNEDYRDSYNRLTDAHVDWSFGEGWNLVALKQSAGFTLDGATSSKRLLTPERNALTHNLWFTAEYFTGIDLKGPCAKGWKCRAGLYSSDGNDEFSNFNASYFSLLSFTRDLAGLWTQDELSLRLDYVHNDKDRKANTRPFNDVVSLVGHWRQGPWGMSTDLSGGLGWDSQGDVVGLVLMPWYQLSPRFQAVARYTYLHSSEHNGLRLNRYERDVTVGRGDEYQELLVGLNWYFYGHKLKWQNSLRYAHMRDEPDDGGEYQGWGLISGLRVYW